MISQLIRYFSAISFIAKLKPNRILEIGCGSKGIGKFCNEKFIGVDLRFDDYTKNSREIANTMTPIIANVKNLPFQDNAFDVVIMVDVIEHLPSKKRSVAVEESYRVSSKWMIVAFPTGKGAVRNDRDLKEWLLLKKIKVPEWLNEHLSIPNPRVSEIKKILDKFSGKLKIEKNSWLPLHRVVMRFEHLEKIAPYSSAISALLAPNWLFTSHKLYINIIRLIVRPLFPAIKMFNQSPAYRTTIYFEKGLEKCPN